MPSDLTNESGEELVGQVIAGRFRIIARLSRGSMGRVLLAEQEALGRRVAVKILDVQRHAFGHPESFERRFLKEASTLASLKHPNTVRVFDFGIWREQTYLVMEYVEGVSLSRLLRDGRLEPRRALNMAAQICRSLREAHGRGIVHRDLKPSNLLITQLGEERDFVKVVDFGLVKHIDDTAEMTGSRQMIGSPKYMAPEQVRCEDVDQRADIYALGVILYRCLTGVAPFADKQSMAVLMAHLHTPPPGFSEVAPDLRLPPCLEWVTQRCLAKKRGDRFADVQQLLCALRVCQYALDYPERPVQMAIRDGRLRVPEELIGLVRNRSEDGLVTVFEGIPNDPTGPDQRLVWLLAGALAVLVIIAAALVTVIATYSRVP